MSLFSGGIALAIGLGASTAGSIVSGKVASGAAKTAAAAQITGNREALAYAKTKDARDRADAFAAQRANYQQYVANEALKAPYRASGQAANQTIAHLLGLPPVDVAPPPPLPSYLQEDQTMAPLTAVRR